MPDFDVLMVGNFAKDKLIVDGIETIASGGGVYYGSITIHRLGLKVAVVTRLSPGDFPRLEELRSEGVTVYATAAEGTSGIANYYQSANMETRLCKPIGFGGKYDLAEIPDVKARVILITPLFTGEVDLSLLRALAGRAPVAMDIQGFLRTPVKDDLIFQPWAEMAEGLKYITYLKVDLAEAEYLTGLTDLHEAALQLQSFGPREIILTQTSGVTAFCDGQFYSSPFTPRSLSGRTGRGDTCFATYIAKRLGEDPQTACRWAGLVTTYKQETPGPWKGSAAAIQAELARMYGSATR